MNFIIYRLIAVPDHTTHPDQGLLSNLPLTLVKDVTIKNNNLIAATQGRSFWIILSSRNWTE